MHAVLLKRFEQAIPRQARPTRLRIAEHSGIRLQPTHHVKETLRPLSLTLREGLITQIPYLIQISDFRKPLRLPSHLNPAYALFAVNLPQLGNSHVKNAALANMNFLFRLDIQPSDASVGPDSASRPSRAGEPPGHAAGRLPHKPVPKLS